MHSGAHSVVAKRLNIRGQAEDVDRARQRLPATLNTCRWPTTDDDEMVIIRRINVRHTSKRLAEAMLQQTEILSRQAVDGNAPAAANALAVRFRNRAALNACLIDDLLKGAAQNQWYWQNWRALFAQPANEAIVELLCQAPLEIPALFHQLPTDTRALLWPSLDEGQTIKIIEAVAFRSGWRYLIMPRNAAMATHLHGGAYANVAHARIHSRDVAAIGRISRAGTLKLQLAAIISVWQQQPQLLQTDAAPMYIQQVIELSLPAVDRTSTEPINSQPQTTGDQPADAAIEKPQPNSAPPQRLSGTSDHVAQRGPAPTSVELLCQKAESAQGHAPAVSPPATLYNDGIISQWGGLFYLLNFLNLPTVRNRIAETDQATTGWHWLYQLGKSLRCEFDEPVLVFLSEQIGEQNTAALHMHPRPTTLDELLRVAERRYGPEIWQAASFKRHARLIGDHSHLDIHLPMQAVDLAARRCGLDINPGWLPWLGRVVHFHYGSGREPGYVA